MEQHPHDGTAITMDYHGKILKGNHSRRLKDHIKATISRMQAFDNTLPVIPYLSAWQEKENAMWYEFTGQRFCELMACPPDAVAQTFRNCILERRVYNYREQNKGCVNTQTLKQWELSDSRRGLRKEGEKKGVVEAVYKVQLPDGSIEWLKDQATVTAFAPDHIHISSGCLTLVTKEMEAEEELLRTQKKLKENAQKLKLAHKIQEKNTEKLSRAIEAVESARKDAEKANRAKSEFLAVISHEIRNPMNGIIGTCDLIMADSLSPRQNEYLDIIKSAAISLLGLINDILDFSKIEAGKLAFMETAFDIRDVIEDVSDLFLELTSKKKLDLVMDIHPDVPTSIISDPMRLRQVLINLTSNALKFTRKGEIVIGVAPCLTNGSHAELEFYVSDTGIGIAPEHLENLFDSFTQVNDPVKQEYGGTGLGLAISRQIVTMMDGTIWVESTPAEGSTFYFKAPFKCAEENKNIETIPREFKQCKALVAANQGTGRQVLRRLLETWGFQVSVADSGVKAVEILSGTDESTALILMDMGLGDLTQPHVQNQLKNISPEAFFIAVTRMGTKEEARLAMDLEITTSLTKPVKESLLLETIKKGFGLSSKIPDADKIPSPPGERFSNTRVLIVEDNLINLKVGSEMLRLAGVDVETAQNGIEAVEKVQKTAYDAVLIDIQMPLLDGIEASRIIRQQFSSQDLPIIAMSAHAKSIKWKACVAAGINDYILKPFNKDALLKVLKNQLGYRHGILPPKVPLQNHAPQDGTPPNESASFPGLNVREGIERLGGSKEIYADILSDFCEEHATFQDALKELLEAQNFKGAATLAHSIKGAAGNISAPQLFEAAKKLELACWDKKEKEIKTLLPTAQSSFEEVVEGARKFFIHIQRIKDKDAPVHPEPFRPSRTLIQRMQLLLESLDSFDPIQSETLATEIQPLVAETENKDMACITKHIKNYQFDDARKILESLMASLES